MPRNIGGGVMAETVGDLMGDTSEFIEVADALDMPRLPDINGEINPLPPLGIHFGMDEDAYHAIPAFSKSHLRNFLCSPTNFWADSWLNPDRAERGATHLSRGKGYHAMILEGHDAYTSRFYPAPDPKEYPKALRSVDEIKQALVERDQKPVAKIDLPGQEGKTRAAKKEDWVAQLVAYDRTVEVWEDIEARAARIAAGRTLLSVDDDRRIRIAARMIAQDPVLAKAFKGGWPEVTLIWRDPHQGVLCKARLDYLKLRAVVDLKSFANSRDKSIRKAILYAIAEGRYCLQPAVYLAGVDAVRKLVREHGASVIHYHWTRPMEGDKPAEAAWAERSDKAQKFAFDWAKADDYRWLWIFQQTGAAPVTRGLWHPLSGTVHSYSQSLFLEGLRGFRKSCEIYGTDPWLDLAEVDDIDESEILPWGLEI